jgi:serine/threonine protein kinase
MKIARDILQGLVFLHETVKIAHLDVKLENILIKRNGPYDLSARLMDFGLSHYIEKKMFRGLRGTTAYCAPEYLCKHFFRKVSDPYVTYPLDLCRMDMYSLGVTLYALCYDFFPSSALFSEFFLDTREQCHVFFDFYYIKKCYFDCYREIEDEIEKDILINARDRQYCNLLKLIMQLLTPLPNERPSAQQAINYLNQFSLPSVSTSVRPNATNKLRFLTKKSW